MAERRVTEWWVATSDDGPVGPLNTQQLVQRIGAGDVPKDALVCEVGGTAWTTIGSVTELRNAVHTFDESRASSPAVQPALWLGDETEQTIVDRPPFPPLEHPEHAEDDDDQRPTVEVRRSLDEPE